MVDVLTQSAVDSRRQFVEGRGGSCLASLRTSSAGAMLRRSGGIARHSPQGRLVLARFGLSAPRGDGERSPRRGPPFHRRPEGPMGRRAGEATNAPWKMVTNTATPSFTFSLSHKFAEGRGGASASLRTSSAGA